MSEWTSIQIQHLLKLNLRLYLLFLYLIYSNTTLVKVKFNLYLMNIQTIFIQIQHLLKLNEKMGINVFHRLKFKYNTC